MTSHLGLSTYRVNDLVALKLHAMGNIIIDFGAGRIWNRRGAEITGHKNTDGYYRVKLSHKGAEYIMMKHRVIYMCYHGINAFDFDRDFEIDHLDGNKENNSISNLRACTGSENCLNPNTLLKGENAPHARLTNEDAEHYRSLYLSGGFTARKLAEIAKISTQAMENLLNNKSYRSTSENARQAALAVKGWRQRKSDREAATC